MTSRVLAAFDRIDAMIAGVCRAVLYLTTVALFTILTINVFLRYLAGTSLQSAGEAPELLFPWMVMAGVVLAAQHGAHISIAWFVERLPAGARRPMAIANCAFLAVIYGTLVYAALHLLPVVADERSHVLGVPASVTYSCLLAGFGGLILTAIGNAVRLWQGVTTLPHDVTIASG
jgi:TRAP-type transport system small permease protein